MTQMSIAKQLSRFSLILLSLGYFNLGWVLSEGKSPWWVWLLVTAFTLAIAETLAFPWSIVRSLFNRWISSDTKAFFAATFASLLTVVFLSWTHISAHGLLLFAAATLARIDLQMAAIREFKAFFILNLLGFAGLGLGSFAHWAANHFELVVKAFNQLF
ncbi:MAG: hypothetical protein MUC60_00085 [Oscillatoria sp. Prado101]|jgi:hypothetical protein|nr:hypothetical protein [Oscillatoria sp. Prado101]